MTRRVAVRILHGAIIGVILVLAAFLAAGARPSRLELFVWLACMLAAVVGSWWWAETALIWRERARGRR